MLPCRQCSFDIFGLTEDGKGDYDAVNIVSEQQIMVGLARAGVIGIEVDFELQSLCGLERARIYSFESEVRGSLHRGQMLVLHKQAAANNCNSN